MKLFKILYSYYLHNFLSFKKLCLFKYRVFFNHHMHSLYTHSFFIRFFFSLYYLTNKLRIIWTFSGEFVFLFVRLQFFVLSSLFHIYFFSCRADTTKRIHLFQNTVFIFVAYFLAVCVGRQGVSRCWLVFGSLFHCAAVTSVISISCQTRKPTTCCVRWISPKMCVRESSRRGREGNQMFVSFHYMFTFVWGPRRSLKLPSSARKLFASDKWNWPRSQLRPSPSLPLSLLSASFALLAAAANYVINLALYRFKLNEFQPKLKASKYLCST